MAALRSTTLAVREMIPLKIGHALLGKRGGDRTRVQRVYSHEQVSRGAEYGQSETTLISWDGRRGSDNVWDT
jgi:prephenate dehydratase